MFSIKMISNNWRVRNTNNKLTVILVLVTLLLSACATALDPNATPGLMEAVPSPVINTAQSPTPSQTIISTPTLESLESPDRGKTMPMPERIPPEEFNQEDPVLGEVPEKILNEIHSDLAQKTGAEKHTIQVIRAQAVTWNDGSLGCPQPGILYTQALVNGYWVVLKIEDQEYDYRVANTGFFFLCEGGLPPNPAQSAPDS